ncbi:MAG: serine/threonine-protein kinase [Chitinophagaceae bacterium]
MKPMQPGITEIAGYKITELLGSGGMGNVYKAWHPSLQREAAIKILHQADMADRFQNEAYIQSSVSHPNIARLYEYLPSAQNPCIIMEYVHGQTLDAYLHTRGKLSSAEVEHIIQQVATALAYLHSKNILHRDIKPQNFKIQPDGVVKMLDFGIAKSKYSPKLTQFGFVVGTTEYMAPEQFNQQPEKKSDIWSLGVMAYELVTGYMPFESQSQVALRAKIEKGQFTKPSLLVPDLSPAMGAFIEKTLRVNTKARISAAEALACFIGQEQKTFAKPALPEINNRNWFTPKKIIAASGILLLLLIVALSGKKNSAQDIPHDMLADTTGVAPVQHNTTERTIKINTPSIDNATLIFPDGQQKAVPCDITGVPGQNIEFTIHADGYADKKVQVEITDRRSAYEYNLEKLNP